ncbi:MAG: hypothetical protein HY617_00935 [Candidatus Sungbacteria bacterium]|nr:hypothetical protein [Candidatus Sungbacteria bacterium]
MARPEPFLDELTDQLFSFGIRDIPKTRKNRTALLHYIGERTPQERADMLRMAQEKWIGKRVVHGGLYGVIVFILPKGGGRLPLAPKDYPDGSSRVQSTPFSAAVLWDGDNQVRMVSEVNALKVIES